MLINLDLMSLRVFFEQGFAHWTRDRLQILKMGYICLKVEAKFGDNP